MHRLAAIAIATFISMGATAQERQFLNPFDVTDATKVPALRVVRDKYVDTAHPPASTLVEVRRLVRDDLLLEVEATAVVSATSSR